MGKTQSEGLREGHEPQAALHYMRRSIQPDVSKKRSCGAGLHFLLRAALTQRMTSDVVDNVTEKAARRLVLTDERKTLVTLELFISEKSAYTKLETQKHIHLALQLQSRKREHKTSAIYNLELPTTKELTSEVTLKNNKHW